jgi:hypothetical protein
LQFLFRIAKSRKMSEMSLDSRGDQEEARRADMTFDVYAFRQLSRVEGRGKP